MHIEQRHIGTALVIAPAGRIDQTTSAEFESGVMPLLDNCKAGATPIVLDFSAVEYVSSAGLRILMLVSRKVASQQGKIAIAALQPFVKEVFEISRFTMVYKLFDTVEGAVSALEQTA